MAFCTAVNCMDGRVQLPVINYLIEKFGVEYVDSVTEPGPNRILAEEGDGALGKSIMDRIRISVEKHGSVGIAVIGHFDCAGNPTPEGAQTAHTEAAVEFLKQKFPGLPVIGMWVGEDLSVSELI